MTNKFVRHPKLRKYEDRIHIVYVDNGEFNLVEYYNDTTKEFIQHNHINAEECVRLAKVKNVNRIVLHTRMGNIYYIINKQVVDFNENKLKNLLSLLSQID